MQRSSHIALCHRSLLQRRFRSQLTWETRTLQAQQGTSQGLRIQRFVRTYVQPADSNLPKMRDKSWDTPYIHGKDQEGDQTLGAHNFESTMTVFLNDQRVDFSPETFLHDAWTQGFDTPCTTCKEHFDLATEPPVRLLGLGQHVSVTDPLRQDLPPLHVRNYHLRCLKASNIRYIPVSHPWHSSIAEAYALRTFNAKAAQTCYEAPIRTLMAVQRRFGSDCLLWHDYISIPQWQDNFRGTVILPQIFKIFEASGSSILHLGQQPPSEIVRTPTLEMINQYNDGLQQFFTAHLFTRLWPIVEFDRAGEAYIMSNEYTILEPKFTVFVKEILDATTLGSTGNNGSVQWVHNLPLFVRERQKNKCFGYVFDMIANLGCRSFRDKFIGASELLGILDYPKELPVDVQDACLWLAERQIQSNDLSPLLLRPSQEPPHAKASWLKGHQSIVPNMWVWGVEIQPSKKVPQVQHHSVHLDLHYVGNVTHNLSWAASADHSSNSASDELHDLLSSKESAERLIECLEAMNPHTLIRSDHINKDLRAPTLHFRISTSNFILGAFRHILDQVSQEDSKERLTNSSTLYDDIMSLLALSASAPAPELEHFGSFDFFKLRQQLCDSSESNLVSVTCPDCLTQSSFRAQLWRQPTADTRLYLIPGLTYQYTAVGGVGLLLEKGHIIGRARFCAAPCSCNHDVRVKIT
ncbi:hypothetical protein IQ07DRAFT_108846 [Pyrenochaeta sp. DS3sAY3a]|nr:hypothetical protein IQ07DRAFT_108846 [Pyrenochaeta sp. DS3sAY3a]